MQKSNKLPKIIIVVSLILLLIVGYSLANIANCTNTGGGSACIAQSGYLCQIPIYMHDNADILVTVGQNTGRNWETANFVFVPESYGTSTCVPPHISFSSSPANTVFSTTGLISGQVVQVWLPVTNVSAPVPIGTPAIGSIWAQYTTQQNPEPKYHEIGILNVKAS